MATESATSDFIEPMLCLVSSVAHCGSGEKCLREAGTQFGKKKNAGLGHGPEKQVFSLALSVAGLGEGDGYPREASAQVGSVSRRTWWWKQLPERSKCSVWPRQLPDLVEETAAPEKQLLSLAPSVAGLGGGDSCPREASAQFGHVSRRTWWRRWLVQRSKWSVWPRQLPDLVEETAVPEKQGALAP